MAAIRNISNILNLDKMLGDDEASKVKERPKSSGLVTKEPKQSMPQKKLQGYVNQLDLNKWDRMRKNICDNGMLPSPRKGMSYEIGECEEEDALKEYNAR